MKEKKNIKDTLIRPAKDPKKTMRLNHFLSNRYVVTMIVVLVDILFFCLLNYIINTLYALPAWLQDLEHPQKYIGLANIWLDLKSDFTTKKYFILLEIAFVIVLDIILVYRIRTYLSDDYFNVGQKGDSRWATIEEIQQQYKEVDEKDTCYPGLPGILVSRHENKIYIDDSPVNNLIIGITRSGKGEMFVFPSIDVYSRAEIQPSMIICDPKMELYKASKKTLEERGYDVHLLNLADPLHSMGFNPLTEIIETYKKKDYATAELLAQSFAYSVFNPDEATGDSQFFDTTSAALLTALIIAHIDDCLREDEKNAKTHLLYAEKRKAYDDLKKNDPDAASEAYMQYCNYKKQGFNVITNSNILYLPPEEKPPKKYEEDINMYSIINTFTELGRQKIPNSNLSMLDVYFSERPMLDRAKLKYSSVELAGSRTKGSVYANMLAKMTIFTYENIAKMTAESSINLKDIGFGQKPLAIFLGIPDHDRSTHFLASVFIRQTYFVLAKMCGEVNKCKRPVKFICDEFGNIPAIEAMANIITVCLGRNISFDLYVQNYSQINSLYGDDAETIIGNCGNQIYIMTNELNTAENYSKLLGNETITDLQRTGKKLELSKTIMESNIEKPLLNMNQLMELKPGDCVIKRVMKRTDLQHNKIVPHPIYNCEEFHTVFKYRYEYLTDSFPNPDEIELKKINDENRDYIHPTERVWDYDTTFRQFTERKKQQEYDLIDLHPQTESASSEMRLCQINKDYYYQIQISLKSLLGNDYEQIYGIHDDMFVRDFMDIIKSSDMKAPDKNALLAVIQGGMDTC